MVFYKFKPFSALCLGPTELQISQVSEEGPLGTQNLEETAQGEAKSLSKIREFKGADFAAVKIHFAFRAT